jgi:HPt (histidine-containing phosphotransfer) domain-containing protein
MNEGEDIINELRGQYIRGTTDRLRRIGEMLDDLESMPSDFALIADSLEELKRQFHSLVGSGRTYGFPGVTTIASRVEAECAMLQAQNQSPASDDLNRWREKLAELKREVWPQPEKQE